MKHSKLKTFLGRWLSGFTFPSRCARFYLQILTLLTRRRRSFVAVLSGDETHAYSAAHGVRALGRKVLLITATPQLQEMAYADAIILTNPISDPEKVLSELEAFELDGVLVCADTDLLPLQHRIADRFGLISVGVDAGRLGNDKFAWREALTKGNVPQPYYSTDPKQFEGKACIRKPRQGWSSKGVKALSARDDKVKHSGAAYYFEAVIPGDQYNFEGIVRNGEVQIFARMFDRFIDFNGALVPRYTFMDTQIHPARAAALEKCTRETLAASHVVNGAFHLEMRMDGDRALPIDFANRIGSLERAVSFSSGCNLGEAHAGCFLAGSQSPKMGKPKPMLQYWCWTEGDLERARKIVEQYPDWVFDTRLHPHAMNGETSLGTVTLYHEDRSALLKMTDSLDLQLQ